jgi:hypothetical protein
MGIDWREHMLAKRSHTHLRLAAALDPLPRQRRGAGGGGGVRYPNRARHARDVGDQVSVLRERHKTRAAVFGIHPDLVLVVIFNRAVAGMDEKLEDAGLQFLAAAGREAIAAFASDPEMAAFIDHLARYGQGVPPRKTTAHYEGLFDSIESVRALTPSDVIDRDVQEEITRRPPTEITRLDIQCWCPEDEPEGRRRFDETLRAIAAANGSEVNSSFRYQSGLSLIRADVPVGAIEGLAQTDRVRQISLLPRPALTQPQMIGASYSSMPPVEPPDADAPILAVIDSGVRASHPLLDPAVLAAIPGSDHVPDGGDEHGHGTLVASLALYGSLETKLRDTESLRPAGWLLSIRVLDRNSQFPDADLWVEQLEAAIRLAAEHGARVVNLSLGDSRHPYRAPGPDPVAAIVDGLARELNLVVVISVGNFASVEYIGDPDIASSYPTWLLEYEDASLLPPATSALALSVGALVADSEQGAQPSFDSVDVRLLGKPGQPSPATRVGPGIEQMVKPELTAAGGTYAYDTGLRQFVPTPYGRVVGAAANPPDRLLASDTGTSFAAPLVSHAALRVLGRYPTLSAPAVRALLLATILPVEPVVDSQTAGEQRKAQLRLTGYGRASADQAEYSEDYRAVLLAESNLRADQTHFYSIPIPESFFASGPKLIALGLAFDPEVRATRLKYMSSRMSVFAYRGVSVETVRAKYAVHPDDDKPPEELDRYKCQGLLPSDKTRLLGANQAASQMWSHAWDAQYRGSKLVIVVRNTSRWPSTQDSERYALALMLRTSEDLEPPLYGQLRAELPLLTEIEPEIETDQ